MKKYTYVTGVITIILLGGSIFAGNIYAQSVCGIIYEENGSEEEIEDCDNQFEANSAFPFTLIAGGVVITEGASYEMPLGTTQTILLQATNADDVDAVALYRHEGQDFYGIEIDEISPETQYETLFEQAGTYTLVLNRETELVTFNETSLWQQIKFWLLPTAHALEYPFSEIFTRTFTITEPFVEAECGFIVFDSYQLPIEDCDNPLGVAVPNSELAITFSDVAIEEGQAYPFEGISDVFTLSGADPQANALRSILYRHEGEDYIVEQDGLEAYTFATTGTYSIVVTEEDLILSDASFLQQIRSVIIPTAHAALGDVTIITFEVVAGEEEPEPLSDLLLQYEPVLYFHPDEDYFPMNVEAFVEGSGLWDSTLIDENLVPRGDGNILSLDYLATTTDTTNWYLAYSSDEAGTIDLVEAKRRYDEATFTNTAMPTYYAYEMEDEYVDEFGVVHRFKVLQYWYFYAMNNWAEQGGFNNHEGDWESVFVFLDADTEEPMYAAFSAHHNDGEPSNLLQFASVRRNWDSDDTVFDEGQIVSFVSVGSHANYSDNGNNGEHYARSGDDLTSNDGLKYYESEWNSKFLISTEVDSVFSRYQGLWGTNKLGLGTAAPQGPLYSDVSGIVRFENPIEWAGIDQLSELVVDEPTDTLTFNQSDITMQFAQALENGTIVTVDPHDEFINFGVNIAEIDLLPHYYDFGTSLADGTFEVHVTLTYTDEELEALELSEDALTIYYYNDVTDIWEVVDATVDTVLNTLTFTTNHFSVYAIGVVEQTEEQTLEELYEQLRTTISDTELRRLYKKLLIRQVVLSKRFAEREHPVSIKIAKKLLENVQRRITRYERRGLLTEDEKNKIEVDVNKVLEKLNFEIT